MQSSELLGFILCCFVSAVLCWHFVYQRSVFLKPSVCVLTVTHIFLQWPLVWHTEFLFDLLPNPIDALLLVHGFVIIGLPATLLTWRDSAERIYSSVANWRGETSADVWRLYIIVLALAALTGTIYLLSVPISSLGLIVGFINPDLAESAREESFKLVGNPLIRYSYALFRSSLAPMSGVILGIVASDSMRARKWWLFAVAALLLICLLVLVSLSGARSFAAMFLATLVFSLFLRNSMRMRIRWVLLAGLLVVTPSVLLTLLREGRLNEVGLLPAYYWDFVGRRIFFAPLQVGLWHMHFNQIFGDIGVEGIPRLASLLGHSTRNVPNEIGLFYSSTGLASISANAGYIFSYYAKLGLGALPVCLFALLLLDIVLPILERVPLPLRLPSCAAMLVSTLGFIQSDFTVTLLTHGFAVSPIMAWFVGTSSVIFFGAKCCQRDD